MRRISGHKLFIPLFMGCIFSLSIGYSGITSGADFLKIPRSARAIALGDSYTAVIDDATAIDYNPAAMNTIKNLALSAMYQTWFANSYTAYASGAYRFHDLVIGASAYYLNYGGLDSFDNYGNLLAQYDPYDLNIKAGFSMDGGFLFSALRGFSFGAALSGVQRKLLEQTVYGLSVNGGLNYKTTLGRFINLQDEYLKALIGNIPIYAGLSLQNIGYSPDTLAPLKISLGMAVGLLPDFYVSMDFSKEYYDTLFMWKCGVEYTIAEILTLRSGFIMGKDTGNVSFGLGVKYPFLFNTIRFDYAFTPLGTLGNNHNLSVYSEFLFNATTENYYQKGMYYYAKKDYLKCKEMWNHALELEPNNKIIKDKLNKLEVLIKILELETDLEETKEKQEQFDVIMQSDLELIKAGVYPKGQTVTFVYHNFSKKVQSVAIMGDFNSWDKKGLALKLENGVWTITMKVAPGLHQYKFIINGTLYIPDPANKNTAPDGQGGKNSIFEAVSDEPLVSPEAQTNTNITLPLEQSEGTNALLLKEQSPLTNSLTIDVTNRSVSNQ